MHFTEWSPRYFTYLALDIVTVSTSLGPVSLPQCSSPRVRMHVGTYGDDSLTLPPRLLTEPRGPTSLEVFVCPTPSRHNENRKQQWSERPRGGSLGCSTTWDGCFLLLTEALCITYRERRNWMLWDKSPVCLLQPDFQSVWHKKF